MIRLIVDGEDFGTMTEEAVAMFATVEFQINPKAVILLVAATEDEPTFIEGSISDYYKLEAASSQ